LIRLVLATRNTHKIEELRYFLAGLPMELLTLDGFPEIERLIEDGTSFHENALRKARQVYDHTRTMALADDSGLEVFFLNGRPGVYSARYAGENAGDEANNQKLLAEMRGVAARRRVARFKAVLALVGESYEETSEGICSGSLSETPRGTNGFGYDPIFMPDGFSKTYAELTAEEKNSISHRSKAFLGLRQILAKKIL
jgi:XTP/dITP diphosphohydrolase